MTEGEILKELGKRIAELRVQKGLTQNDLALKCDIERSNLARIETGNTNPTYLTLLIISRALEVSVVNLIDIEY
jgi:transcriptional regulator with XRE-family HTH domain